MTEKREKELVFVLINGTTNFLKLNQRLRSCFHPLYIVYHKVVLIQSPKHCFWSHYNCSSSHLYHHNHLIVLFLYSFALWVITSENSILLLYYLKLFLKHRDGNQASPPPQWPLRVPAVLWSLSNTCQAHCNDSIFFLFTQHLSLGARAGLKGAASQIDFASFMLRSWK